MEHLPEPPAYLSKVLQIDQAIFYCYNETGQRIPVNTIRGFNFIDDNTLQFKTSFFPVVENAWDSFAGELHFYKKGISSSLKMEGIAMINISQNGLVLFSIKHVEYFDATAHADNGLLSTLFKPYMYVYKKGSELLQHTFRRKILPENISNLSA